MISVKTPLVITSNVFKYLSDSTKKIQNLFVNTVVITQTFRFLICHDFNWKDANSQINQEKCLVKCLPMGDHRSKKGLFRKKPRFISESKEKPWIASLRSQLPKQEASMKAHTNYSCVEIPFTLPSSSLVLSLVKGQWIMGKQQQREAV